MLDITKTITEIQKTYKSRKTASTRTFMIGGDFGTGKSSSVRTAPGKVYIASFDPGGTTSGMLSQGISEGDVLVERFEDEVAKTPTQWKAFEKRIDELVNGGFFDGEQVKTLVLDSATNLSEIMMNEIAARAGRAGQQPQLQDYQIQQLVFRDLIKKLTTLPVNLIMTTHLEGVKDELSGRLSYQPMLSGKLSVKLPLLFDEVYVAQCKSTSKGAEYSFLTENDGMYRARTRIGAGKFEKYEPQNFTALMKKAGII